VVAADVSSCFPLAAHRLGWYDVVTAEHLRRQDVTDEVRERSELAAADPATAIDPEARRHFGMTICEVVPDGQRFIVEVEDEHRPDGRTEVVALHSAGRTAFYSEPDVEAASVLSGRAVEVVRAVRYVPEGRQPHLRRRLRLLPGLVLDLDQDPVLAIVRRRRVAKARGETVLADVLHALVNSLVSGNPSRLDPTWQKTARGWRRWEKPGPWYFMPLAVCVQGTAHLLLAVLERLVADRGGCIAYRDTDSSFIVASPDGATLPDGRRVLPWAEVDEVLSAFESFSLPDWPAWKTERGTPKAPLHSIVFGPKRHIEFVEGAGGPELVGFTEANLGGQFVAPPDLPQRGDDGHYDWVKAVAEREVRYALDRVRSPKGAYRRGVPWAPLPSLRRLPVTTPEVLAGLPKSLGARPGSCYLAATPYYRRDREVVTLDRGASPSDWPRLAWADRSTGLPVPVTLALDGSALALEPLSTRAVDWTKPARGAPISEVTLDPLLVQHVGRVSGVIDAHLLGLTGELESYRPRYDDADRQAAVQKRAAAMGARAFQRTTGLPLTVAERAALGRPISRANVTKALGALRIDDGSARRCALEGCGHPVFRARALYCTCREHASHQDLAKKRRRRAKAALPGAPGSAQRGDR
jgi:hypothetical protein